MDSKMFRRDLLELAPGLPLIIQPARAASAQQKQPASQRAETRPITVREFLVAGVYTREQVAALLDPAKPNFAKFDPELGYLMCDHIAKDGVDGCRTTVTFGKTGERTMINYASRPCRLNVYGDSFTQGVQVSDGETWLEHLAAHLGEPVRNFGVGGYGVYQAYRRMLRHEAASTAADYVILNIWAPDDHLRSIDAWRWLRLGGWRTDPRHIHMIHANPWSHVRLDLTTGKLIEHDNPYATPESLYKLCDKEHVYQRFNNDLVVQLVIAQQRGTGFDVGHLKTLADAFHIAGDFGSSEATARTARALHTEYGLRATTRILEKALTFARSKDKKLMIMLSYSAGDVMRACEGLPRFDQSLIDYLKEARVPFIDLLEKHVEDFKSFRLSPREYVRRYYIGHYKPQGNHFCAFAVKDAIVNWLDPKPLAYREGAETV
jgi:hypothetical protein